MKYFIKIILASFLIFSGCSTSTNVITKQQREINIKQEKLAEDAKDFIATAKHILSQKDINREKIQKAIDIIEKSQTLLGAKIDDGEEFKHLKDKELDAAIENTYKEDKKELDSIEVLEEKNKELVSDIITENVKQQAIADYERKKSIKRWCFFGGILSILGALFYFFPTKFLSIGANIIGFFIRK
jgi:hypothetical protein